MEPEKYQPSNGTEGMEFYSQWCDSCENEGDVEDGLGCGILARTMILSISDENYPEEWCYDEHGVPCCTRYNTGANEHTAKARELREKRGQLRLF